MYRLKGIEHIYVNVSHPWNRTKRVIGLWYMYMHKTHNLSNCFQIFFKYICMWNILISNTQNQSLMHVYLMILMLDYCVINLIRGCHCSWVMQVRLDVILSVTNLLHYILRWFITQLYVRKPHRFPYYTNKDDCTVSSHWCGSNICCQVCLVKIIGLYFVGLNLVYFSTRDQILVMFFDFE